MADKNSPTWSQNTKLVISLTVVTATAALLLRFHTLLGPIFFALILAYLLHPIASFLEKRLPVSWQMTVSLIYLVFIILLVTLLTWGGFYLVQQVQSLIVWIQETIVKLPDMISSLSHQIVKFGPFNIDFSKMDLAAVGQQVLATVEPMIGRLGNLVSNLASGAASTMGWLAFIVIASYFFLTESGGIRDEIIHLDVPGYNSDLNRISIELGHVWNAFLRGQLTIFVLTFSTYGILLPILGVNYAIGLALLAAFANFLPYIGVAINWTALGLVAYFQPSNPFGMPPLTYTLVVIVSAVVVDQVFNNLVIPRILSRALKVHPAAVLITAIIAANLIGFIGLLIAAPVLASLTMIARYTLRKMLNKDPWLEEGTHLTKKIPPSIFIQLKTWWQSLRKKPVKHK
jgi:predicted PurR-regulated permease PerM